MLAALVLLMGLAGGFAISQFTQAANREALPDADLVLYESADVAFPIEGAAFTTSAFNASKKQCERDLLKRLLRADERRLDAWLDIQEVEAAAFDAFVERLKTRILTKATPVTNFGCFDEGDGECGFSIQSVLGPGTPVWIDPANGDQIVAKCACSNPLRDPRCPPNCEVQPTPTPTSSPTLTPTPLPTPTPSPTVPPTPTATPAPTPSPTLTVTASPSVP